MIPERISERISLTKNYAYYAYATFHAYGKSGGGPRTFVERHCKTAFS